MGDRPAVETFSEKGFYLSEFRGRTLAIAARAGDLRGSEPLEALLRELDANATRVVLISSAGRALTPLAGRSVVDAAGARFEGRVWRALSRGPRVGVVAPDGDAFPSCCRQIAERLGLPKLMWVDPGGGLRRPGGGRRSFVDLALLRQLLVDGLAEESPTRRALLEEIQLALENGVAAMNLSTLEGLAEELFTYAGSGTLFTRQDYVEVRRLGLDDYDAADHLIARGVEEGFLAPRDPQQVEQVLASGFGAFVEGRYLAGIGALLDHEGRVGEIAALYTLTRFLGEGIGGHLIGFALARARARGFAMVFACTTSERVAGFFERYGFRPVDADALPPGKWKAYDAMRRARVRCLRIDL